MCPRFMILNITKTIMFHKGGARKPYLIIGTIIQQIGTFIPGTIGDSIFMMGKIAASVTGAGIGCGVAVRFKESPLVIMSAATCGMMGAFASKILAGTVLVDGAIVFAGPGEPMGAFIAALAGIYMGRLVSGKTKVDIIITPLLVEVFYPILP